MVTWAFRTVSRFAVCASLLVLGAPSDNSDAHVVDLGYAKYAGNFTGPHSVAYLGLPYAEPPLGDRRWRAPVPLDTDRIRRESGGRTVDAKSYPNFCIQGGTGAGDAGGAGTEDCLNVNVYAPAGAKQGDNLPVLVYIHGGGYFYGNPANWPFDHWINQSPNVVVVSVYYRLSSLGFLAHSGFVSDKSLGDLNVGFLDQREALRWVQKHISAFGGNPKKVTINGESAGGGSVALHLVAQNEDGLFQAAIAQSVYRHPVQDPKLQEPMFDHFASQAGCGTGSTADKMTCLRNASVSAIARAQDSRFSGPWNSWHPVKDANTIAEYPTLSYATGRYHKVPVIVGAVSNETIASGTIPSALKALFPGLTDQDLADFVAEYPLSAFSSADEQFRSATGESLLRCAREIIAAEFSKVTNAYTYRYNQHQPGTPSPLVEHAAENWMMFKGTDTGPNGTTIFHPQTPTEVAFAEELIAYWLSFVRSHDPNTYKLARSPVWQPFSNSKPARIVLQQNSTTASGSYIETDIQEEIKRCAFVASKVRGEQN